MTNDHTRNFAKLRLEQLRAGFQQRLHSRVAELRQAIGVAHHNERTRERATRLAHQLAGVAGSYGHREVGLVAARLERALVNREDHTPVVAQLDRLIKN